MAQNMIEIREPGKAPRKIAIDNSVELGRETQGIIIDDAQVSRRHAVLRPTTEGLEVCDLGSTNGSVVNGVLISGPTLLHRGDVVRFGDTEVEVMTLTNDQNGRETAVAPVAAAEPPPLLDAVGIAPIIGGPTDPTVADESVAPSLINDASRLDIAACATATGAVPARPPAAAPPRAALDELASRSSEAAVVRFRPGSPGEKAAGAMLSAAARARRRLAGFGSEPWGVIPQICLVDPFPDPDRPGELITGGTVVDASRSEIWMVVTAESPPEPPERSLALLFGGSFPAAADIQPLLEGYGLHVADAPDQDAVLREIPLPPLAESEGDVRGAMARSFVAYLVERGGQESLVRLLATAQPGRVDAAAQGIFGVGMASLEDAWRSQLSQGPPNVKSGQFLRLALRYLRPHWRREAEMFVYMLLGLAFTMIFPFVFKRLLDTAIPSGKFSEVVKLLTVLTVAFGVSLLAGLRRAYLASYVGGSVVRDVRTGMYDRLQSLSAGWFGRHQQGDVLSRLFSDVQALEGGLSQTLRDGLGQALSLVVAAAVLVKLDPLLGVIVIAGAPLVALVYRTMSAGAQKRSIAVQEETGSLLAIASENFGAQPVVKAFALEPRERARFRQACDRLFGRSVKLQLFGGLFGLAVNSIVTILRVVVLGLGAWLILHGHLTIGGLVAFISLMGEVLSPVTVLTGIGQQVQSAAGALVRVNEILDAAPDIADSESSVPLPRLEREITLNNVGFSYTPERQTLEAVDCTIAAGSRVAFVGPTGAGKSSILQLLTRFYEVDEGSVQFDGRDIRTATLASLRGQIGVVFQETFLFDTTIRENIALGRPGSTDEEIEAAAKAAELHDYIVTLPRGYDTLVGERGGRLSGGQKQRLAIARALLREPTVLLLDEATSALDPRTERLIGDTLDRVAKGRTTIAVTHRLTSVVAYDRIFVIVGGHLVEQGKHEELLRVGGVYADLWAEQTGGVVAAEAPFDVEAALVAIPLFAGLSSEALRLVAGRLRSVELATGARVSEDQGGLLLMRNGRAEILAPNLDGDLVAMGELGAGDAFGLSALLGQSTGTVLVARGPVAALMLDDEAITAISATLPQVGLALAGNSRNGLAPVGGQRLSRLTMGPSPTQAVVIDLTDKQMAANVVRRATSSMTAVGQ